MNRRRLAIALLLGTLALGAAAASDAIADFVRTRALVARDTITREPPSHPADTASSARRS